MITATEAGLTDGQMTSLLAGKEMPSYSIIAERYNLSFSEANDASRTVAGMDAIVSGSYLIRAVIVGSNVEVERSVDGITWTSEATISGINTDVPPSLAISGNTVRVFYYDTSDNLSYRESTDNGDTWGAEVDAGAQTGITFMAAVSLTKVHTITYTSPNSRFHFWEDDGGWAKTDSNIYWAHRLTGLDAITIGSKDLLVFASNLQTRYGDTRQGVCGTWEANSRWSEHFDIDVVDEKTTYRYRNYPRLSSNGGYYLLTFYASDGTEDNPVVDRCITRSKDGQWWEKRTLAVCDEAGRAVILVLDNDAYVVGSGKTFTSYATRYVGYTPQSGDTVYYGELRGDVIQSLRSQMGRMRQTTFVLSDEDGSYAAGMFAGTKVILLSYSLGYNDSGAALLCPYSIEEVDFHKEVTQLAQDLIAVSSRDRMAWLSDAVRAADHYREWNSQLLGRDRFRDETGTGYGGLRHTATSGWFDTEAERLRLIASNNLGIGLNTFSTAIANGVIQSGVMFASNGNSEYVGLVFRAANYDNYFRACFEDAEDKITLRRVIAEDVGAILASTAALGWTAGTQYYLRAEFRYSLITVYYSTDGVAWTQAFQYVDVTGANLAALLEGQVGYIGYGYSDEDTEPPEPPPLPPTDPGSPGTGGGGDTVFFLCDGHIYRGENILGPTADVVYTDLCAGAGNPTTLIDFRLDPWDPANKLIAITNEKVYRAENISSSSQTWTEIADEDDFGIPNAKCLISLDMSICKEGFFVFLLGRSTSTRRELYAIHTYDGGNVWSSAYVVARWAAGYTEPEYAWGSIECSSHTHCNMWVTFKKRGDDDIIYIFNSDGGVDWSGYDQQGSPIDHFGGDYSYAGAPQTLHRYLQNDDDEIAFMACPPQYTLTGKDNWIASSGIVYPPPKSAGQGRRFIIDTWGTKISLIGNDTGAGETHLYVSNNHGADFVHRYNFGEYIGSISGFSYDADYIYVSRSNTAVAPVLLSTDGGFTFTAKAGNWVSFGVSASAGAICSLWLE